MQNPAKFNLLCCRVHAVLVSSFQELIVDLGKLSVKLEYANVRIDVERLGKP